MYIKTKQKLVFLDIRCHSNRSNVSFIRHVRVCVWDFELNWIVGTSFFYSQKFFCSESIVANPQWNSKDYCTWIFFKYWGTKALRKLKKLRIFSIKIIIKSEFSFKFSAAQLYSDLTFELFKIKNTRYINVRIKVYWVDMWEKNHLVWHLWSLKRLEWL